MPVDFCIGQQRGAPHVALSTQGYAEDRTRRVGALRRRRPKPAASDHRLGRSFEPRGPEGVQRRDRRLRRRGRNGHEQDARWRGRQRDGDAAGRRAGHGATLAGHLVVRLIAARIGRGHIGRGMTDARHAHARHRRALLVIASGPRRACGGRADQQPEDREQGQQESDHGPFIAEAAWQVISRIRGYKKYYNRLQPVSTCRLLAAWQIGLSAAKPYSERNAGHRVPTGGSTSCACNLACSFLPCLFPCPFCSGWGLKPALRKRTHRWTCPHRRRLRRSIGRAGPILRPGPTARFHATATR